MGLVRVSCGFYNKNAGGPSFRKWCQDRETVPEVPQPATPVFARGAVTWAHDDTPCHNFELRPQMRGLDDRVWRVYSVE